MNHKSKITNIENTLSPKQSFLLWLDESHSLYPTMEEGILYFPDELERIQSRAVNGAKALYKKSGDRAKRKALNDVRFLQLLFAETNSVVYRFLRVLALMPLLLIEGRRKHFPERAMAALIESYILALAAGKVSETFFDGHPVLYGEAQKEITKFIGVVEDQVIMYNLDHKPAIDLDAIKEDARSMAPQKVKEIVDHVKAEIFREMGMENEAMGLITPYITTGA